MAILLGWAGVLRRRRAAAEGGSRETAAPDPAAMAEGQALFAGCAAAVTAPGRGGKGPDLTDDRWLHGGTDDDIARMIQNGVPGTTMKKLGDASSPTRSAR